MKKLEIHNYSLNYKVYDWTDLRFKVLCKFFKESNWQLRSFSGQNFLDFLEKYEFSLNLSGVSGKNRLLILSLIPYSIALHKGEEGKVFNSFFELGSFLDLLVGENLEYNSEEAVSYFTKPGDLNFFEKLYIDFNGEKIPWGKKIKLDFETLEVFEKPLIDIPF